MVTPQSQVPLTLNANLRCTTILLSFSHYRSCLFLASMLTCISCSAQQLCINSLGFVSQKCVFLILKKFLFLILKKSSFYFKFCFTQQTWHPHLLFSSAFIHHMPLNDCNVCMYSYETIVVSQKVSPLSTLYYWCVPTSEVDHSANIQKSYGVYNLSEEC